MSATAEKQDKASTKSFDESGNEKTAALADHGLSEKKILYVLCPSIIIKLILTSAPH
jgi:hypothetical protein